MPSLLDIPNEIIVEISRYLSTKKVVDLSLANRELHKILQPRLELPKDCDSLLITAIEKRRDPAALKRIISQLDPGMFGPYSLIILPIAFKNHNDKAVELLCGEDGFGIYQNRDNPNYPRQFFEAIIQGHELAARYFIKLWPNSLGTALVGAAAGGSAAITRYLIENGAEIDAAGPEDKFHSIGWHEMVEEEVANALLLRDNITAELRLQLTPLAWAAANGHLEVVQLLVQHNARIDFHDQFGFTPLCWAAGQGRLEVISYILSIPPAEDAQDLALEAFRVAGARDQSEVIKFLWGFLTNKLEPNPDNARWLIRAATVCQDITLLQQLFKVGYGNYYSPPLTESAISIAIENHNFDMFKLLLDQLAYGDQILPDLLQKAVVEKDETVFSYLLDRVNITELNPLVLVDAAPCESIFRELLRAGVSRAALLPFTERFITRGRIHVVQTLLEEPGFRLEDHINRPILDCAVAAGRPMFEFLQEQHRWDEQLSPHTPDANRALELTVIKGDLELLQILFSQGFSASEQDLILLAARTLQLNPAWDRIINFLLERNQEALSEINSDGQSLLFRLMSSGHPVAPEAIRFLLRRGADPLQQDNSGNTPFDEAARNGRQFRSFFIMKNFLEQRDDRYINERVAKGYSIMKENAGKYLRDLGV
ncbi:ankyrin repeat-containing domain protein [Aspergillus granulosus]|uniref:Ankyrin repeat-containing domain protein n=1 Tax=Aspergillus granulosus TaxID=176169 RepID=A0ABR4GUE7_9EURO